MLSLIHFKTYGIRIVGYCICAMLSFWVLSDASLVSAQEQEENQKEVSEPKAPVILDVNYERLESQGIRSNIHEGALGRDLWSKSRRSALTAYIPRLPAPGPSPAAQDLTYGLLLSRADADLINNDQNPEPGKDLLTIRLEKILSLGLYREALALYSDLNQNPYHPDLARLGIVTLLLNKESALACLEYKTLGDRHFKGEFWAALLLFCADKLGENEENENKPDPTTLSSEILKDLFTKTNHKFAYTAKRAETLTLDEKAFLVAKDALVFSSSYDKDTDKIRTEDIQLVISQDATDLREYFPLYDRAAKHGIISYDTLSEIYQDHKIPNSDGEDFKSDDLASWEKRIWLFKQASGTRDDAARVDAFKQAASLSKESTYLLSPFARILRNLDTTDLDAMDVSDLEVAFKSFLWARDDIPDSWAERVIVLANNHETLSDRLLPLLLAALIDHPDKRSDLDEKSLKAFEEKAFSAPFYSLIMKQIDRDYRDTHNADTIYEKDFTLTFDESYVMPSVDLWDYIVYSAREEAIGETVIASLFALKASELNTLYPRFTREIIEGLNKVGLNRYSRVLLKEALLNN